MADEPSPAPAPARRTSARVARKRSTETTEDVKAPKQARTEPADSKEPRGPAAPLQVGDALPALELLDQAEERVRIADLKKVVLFTYPRVRFTTNAGQYAWLHAPSPVLPRCIRRLEKGRLRSVWPLQRFAQGTDDLGQEAFAAVPPAMRSKARAHWRSDRYQRQHQAQVRGVSDAATLLLARMAH